MKSTRTSHLDDNHMTDKKKEKMEGGKTKKNQIENTEKEFIGKMRNEWNVRICGKNVGTVLCHAK